MKDDHSSSALESANHETVIEHNRRAYDQMALANEPLCRPATAEELKDPLGTVDQIGWLGGSITGWRVLCLAAGGGRQSALYAKAGATVTVVDISGQMLELDRRAAHEHGLPIRTIQANMQHLPMLDSGSFDLVVHPVSTCYVADIAPVFAEVARVLRSGGLYISQHKQPINLQASLTPSSEGRYVIEHSYYRDEAIPSSSVQTAAAKRLRESRAIEYLHRWEEIVGGICRAGMVIEDLVEPLHIKRNADSGTFAHRARYIAPYVRIKARRLQSDTSKKLLILPPASP
ncbi:MAG: class I SAM-dependent methyltransferase [Pirellulaceae bacterium]